RGGENIFPREIEEFLHIHDSRDQCGADLRSARGDNVLTRVSWLIPAAFLCSSHAVYAQQACENLVNLKLPYTLITAATSVPEAAAPAPAAPGAPPGAPGTVPAHCDVRGLIRPSSDSNIKFALWLPTASAWNGKYRQEGNGGWAGAINIASFAEPLRR